MYEEQSSGPFGRAHPVLIIGILFFILPFMNTFSFLKWVPGWFNGIGIILIFVGAGLSIMAMRR